MEERKICPFLKAAEELRWALKENPGNPADIKCIGEVCAVWNEGREKCGLVGMKTLSPEDIKKMVPDINPLRDLKK